MNTRLELPDDLIEDVRLRAAEEGRELDETVADLLRIGLAAVSTSPAPAIRAHSSMLEERKRIAEKFITGEWVLELSGS